MTQANRPYTERDAREAFDRMVVRYGWNKQIVWWYGMDGTNESYGDAV